MKNIADFYPLSPMQQGILFHSLYAPHSGAYIDQFHCPILGDLNVAAFQKAWQQVVDRHPILRTSFVWEGLKEPAQIVHKQVQLPWETLDWRGFAAAKQTEKLAAFLQRDRDRGFNFAQAPLIRLTLIRMQDQEYRLVWNRHHLLLDGWSSSLLFEEVFAFYQAFNEGKSIQREPSRPYRDYIAWLQQQDLNKAEMFWRQLLSGFTTVTTISRDRAIAAANQQYDRQQIELSPAVTATLQSLARQHQLTLNTVVQGAWALLLSRYSGENDVVFGAVASGRSPTLAGSESMVGLFINTLPVRSQLNPETPLVSWLQTLQTQQTEARQYEFAPLLMVQQWSELPAGMPLFESILSFQNYPMDFSTRQRGGHLHIADIYTFAPTHYPLTVLVAVQNAITLKIIYDTRRFDGDAIARMLRHLQTILEVIAADPQQQLAAVPMLTAAERHQLLIEWNQTQNNSFQNLPSCVHQLFSAQARKTPDAIALRTGDHTLTYRELEQKSNQLAAYLRSHGVKPDVLVGICLERSPAMVVGLLAILKAGGAYVPLDPAYPAARLRFMVEDAGISVLLTQQSLLPMLPPTTAKIVCVDRDGDAIAQQPIKNLGADVKGSDLAYILYTSGSTGKPKGVQIQHCSLVNFLESLRQRLPVSDRDSFAAVTTLSFDIAGLELYLPLILGAQVAIASREIATDGTQLSEWIAAHQITVMQATPATWRMLITAGWQGKAQLTILCGGEAFPVELARQLCDRAAAVYNLYGPTETTIWSTIYPVKNPGEIIPIGRPIANTQIYLLDQSLQQVPIGVPGEIYIGGMGVAKGYFNRPELTEQRFIPNPFGNGKLYKTGDLARYLPDGNLEYLRRIDHQVKVRGFRIELGEIENLLNQHPEIEQSLVVVQENPPNDQRLVAYILPKNNGNHSSLSREIRAYLKQKLPDYMTPTAFIFLDAFPLTPNGKVDRKTLPAPEITTTEETFVAPQTSLEITLAQIWTEILKVEKVSLNDNFFDLGGHSLLATQLISRIRQTFQVELPFRDLFAAPTLAEVCDRIQQQTPQDSAVPPLVPIKRDRELPLSFAQQRLWFLDQLSPGNCAYNLATAVKLQGALNIAALEQTIQRIINRHESLRTTFVMGTQEPIQVIAPEIPFHLPIIDLRNVAECDRNTQIQQLAQKAAQEPFDLTTAPLVRATLLQCGETDFVLLFAIHHIIADGWSMGVLLREVAAHYGAIARHQPANLPDLTIQPADFALWQRQWLQTPEFTTQLNYWKQQLADIPTINLPTDRPRPAQQSFRGAKSSFVISPAQTNAIASLARQEGVTLFMTLLAAFQILLARYTQQTDIVVGTDVANRNQRELEPLIGFFVNLLVLRTNLSGNPTFRELLRRVRQVTLDAYAHQDVPFAKLVETLRPERKQNHTPFFQVLFVLQNAPMPTLEFSGITLNPLEFDNGTSKFDLALFLTESDQGLVGTWNYSTDLFNAATIERMTTHFVTLIGNILAQPDSFIQQLEMIPNAEKQTQQTRSKFQKFKTVKPKAVNIQTELIRTEYLTESETFPLVIQPTFRDLDLADWIKNNRDDLETQLLKHGGILFRGFSLPTVSDFEQVAQVVCPELFSEYGDLPRQGVSGKVYGSTPYPADKAILFHSESSHLQQWPLKIFFYCVQPAEQGGETPIVDCRKVYQMLDPKLREKFAEKQLMYVRNYIEGLDVSWQEFFKTTDKSVVEKRCRQEQVEFEWLPDNGLRTRQIRRAIAIHPKTQEYVFFNQLQLHHASCLDPEVRTSLMSLFGADKLPRNVYYGDGTPIEDSVMAEISDIYRQASVAFPWQKNDIILLDNMLTAHGRNPFKGSRKIVVAMGEMVNSATLATSLFLQK